MFRNILLLITFIHVSCGSSQIDENQPLYSFFVAGHVYGYPGETEVNIGVHPPFKNQLNLLKDSKSIKFGVFTGDIVFDALKEKEWDEVDQDIAFINKPVYFAPGNHDIGSAKKRTIFTERYGPTYRSFEQGNDLMIILDPNLDGWNISGDQLLWLKDVVNSKKDVVQHIFVFFHQLLWWEKDNEFKEYKPNSASGQNEHTNFSTEVYPLFDKLNNKVYMFAGDTGVYEKGVMYHQKDNITLVASGMGGRKQDNFVITNVYQDGRVDFQLIALNEDDINALGKLEDYKLFP